METKTINLKTTEDKSLTMAPEEVATASSPEGVTELETTMTKIVGSRAAVVAREAAPVEEVTVAANTRTTPNSMRTCSSIGTRPASRISVGDHGNSFCFR